MRQLIFDIEGDSLTPTKIWCLAADAGNGVRDTTSYDKMREELLKADVLIGHNITTFDVPVLEKLLGITIKAKIVDTLALSWYLYPNRNRHGLEWWGEELGIAKPPIIEWDNPAMIGEYRHRCKEDVKITVLLWEKMWKHLMALYGDEERVWKFIDYLSFKMDCAREQERSRWKLDVEKCAAGLKELQDGKDIVVAELIKAMPPVPVVVKKSRPAKPYKADGSLSVHGCNWKKLLKDNGIATPDHDGINYGGEVEVVNGYVDPKPSSPQQVKDWLYSYGWVPETIKYVRDKETGENRGIPQINQEDGGGICDSIEKLYDKNPNFKLLDGLGVVSHRISILNGFMENVDADGYVKARINGLTNTLRFKHKECVNLPGVDKPYGELIRGCLTVPDGHELCGSDMSSLEDRLKCHYIYPHDPDYAEEISLPGYDPHLSLAVSAKALTEMAMEAYKKKKDAITGAIRKTFKKTNYTAQYGAGGPRIAISAGVSEREGAKLHKAYWKKNWAIKVVAAEQTIKTLYGQMWLLNPINGFYYSLRYEKDIFSTLVQGSASYVFDLWVQIFRAKRDQLTAQFHDEVVLCLKIGHREECERLLRDSIEEANRQLQLNRKLDIDVQFGKRYSDIH